MDESGVHFKFLFGSIYLFAYFLPIYLWLCLRAQKKHLQPKKKWMCFSSEGCRTALYTSPICQLIYCNGRSKCTRVHPHGSYCHSISVGSCRDYSGDGSVKDNQKHGRVFQVLALVCIFPASTGGRVEQLKEALSYLDISHMQQSWNHGYRWVVSVLHLFQKRRKLMISSSLSAKSTDSLKLSSVLYCSPRKNVKLQLL